MENTVEENFYLHLACNTGEPKLTAKAIASQLDVNLPDSEGTPPLVLAARLGHEKVMRLLVRSQADVDAQDADGCSSLYVASKQGDVKAVNLLIESLADVNLAKKDDNATPVYVAAQNGHYIVIKRLIDAEVDVNVQMVDGMSPLHTASDGGHCKVAAALIQAGADVDLQREDGSSPLYFASQNGHGKVVNELIKAGADVNLPDNDSWYPLCIASQNGHDRIVAQLLKARADVNAVDEGGTSALHAASNSDFHKVVSALISAQADVNLQDADGCTPLFIASQEGHWLVAEVLIKSQADVDVPDAMGTSPLHTASLHGRHKVVGCLIKAHADINSAQLISGLSPLHMAVMGGHHKVAQLLIDSGADVDHQDQLYGYTPLFVAAQMGHNQVVRCLLRAEANFDMQDTEHGLTPIYIAVQNGHKKAVDLLIEAGANVNLQRNNGTTPLYVASQNGLHEIVETLIEAKANVNLMKTSGLSPLHVAANKGNKKVVQYLIKAGANVSIPHKTGFTAMHFAAQGGHNSVVQLLVQAGADVNLCSSHYQTSPLYQAAQMGFYQVVESLIKAQADVNQLMSDGWSPLYVAANHGHHQVVDMLITAQADVDRQGDSGCTPLYIASQNGYQVIVESLIKSQANVNLQREGNYSPIHVASQNGHSDIVELLIEAGADVSLCSENGQSPLSAATRNEHHHVAALLTKVLADHEMAESATIPDARPASNIDKEDDSATPTSDESLSRELHSALSQAGFTASRAALQSALADVLQQILRGRLQDEDVFVVGSYSEGWGNSLTTLDGRTDAASDIDVMRLIGGRLYHPEGSCNCIQKETSEYVNGHLLCSGFASTPTEPTEGYFLSPAVDKVSASRLCCYPPIGPLSTSRAAESNILKRVLQALHEDLASTFCHVVHAAPPGQGGQQLRVSTTFLERRLLRSLNTLQGQLFVTLKYLVKKVICHKNGYNLQGLKPYHVKTITFRMLERTPPEQWTRPDNLVSLIRGSLRMLLDDVASSCSPENTDGRIMDHFFLSDAALYLKGVDRSKCGNMLEILKAAKSTLQAVIDDLPKWLLKFKNSLEPVSHSGRFYFHPFTVLFYLKVMPTRRFTRSNLEYYQIYGLVRECLQRLSDADCSGPDSRESLTQLTDRFPDWAYSAREALRAMACLKFGDKDGAAKAVRPRYKNGRLLKASVGIKWPVERSATEATADFVLQQLKSQDSAWKFCFKFSSPPRLKFLPDFMRPIFPLQVSAVSVSCYYINFDALLQALRLELREADEGQIEAWVKHQEHEDELEEQQMLVAVDYLSSSQPAVE